MKQELLRRCLYDDPHGSEFLDNIDLRALLEAIREHLQMDVAFIAKFSETERIIELLDCKGTDEPLNEGHADPIGQSYCKKIVDEELPELIPNTRQNAITAQMGVTDILDIGAYMGVPIRLSSGNIYGTFCCYSHQDNPSLSKRDLSILNILADFAAKTIEKQLQQGKELETIRSRITQVLQQSAFHTLFQPIYNLNSTKTVGFEALTRFDLEPLRSPDQWFREAEQVELDEQLEMVAIRRALKGLNDFDSTQYISINASPKHVESGALSAVLSGYDLGRVVLELSEHKSVKDFFAFNELMKPLRARGLVLAIDDVGSGYANFLHILELDVETIKLDVSLIRGIDKDYNRRALAAAILGFANETHISVIAEGVETETELQCLRNLGVSLVQGYHIARPMSLDLARSFEAS